MKLKIQFISFLLLIIFGFSLNAQEFTVNKLWASPDILTTSESVLYYADDHGLFVSCINGNPTDKDGNGFIAFLSTSGEIIHHKWFDGLNAPKGMGIFGGSLFVTDIDRVVQIDLESAEMVAEYQVENAKFLNDIAIDDQGVVYISDMGTNKIHAINNKEVSVWFENEEIINPNGLLMDGEDLVIGSKNGIYSVRISDLKFWHMVKDTGGVDGLKKDNYGNFIISDWVGKIQIVNPEKEAIVLTNLAERAMNAADFEFISKDNILIIPTFADNRVVAFEILKN
ncbi:MAG: hypothetical protein K9H49_07600 [Bacteroidales bacterium]|nr:hypothetical protein [Bacteroidales bacterium]MCF8404498.1 hypothetical protein [Bacteroidales bacterium]